MHNLHLLPDPPTPPPALPFESDAIKAQAFELYGQRDRLLSAINTINVKLDACRRQYSEVNGNCVTIGKDAFERLVTR